MSISATNDRLNLLRAAEGLRNGRTMLLLVIGWVANGLLSAVGVATQSAPGIAFFSLLGVLTALYAACAAGIVSLHAVRHAPRPSLSDALIAAAPAFGKFVLLLLLGVVAFSLYWTLLAALFFLCRIPVIGPVLYALIFPLSIVITAAMLAAAWIALGLLGPAVWEGQSLGDAIARLFAIATQRLVECLVQFVLLALLVGLVGFGVGALLVYASVIAGGISTVILGIDPGIVPTRLLDAIPHLALMGGASGYVVAGLLGAALVFGVAAAALSSMLIHGSNLIYLQMSAGLDNRDAQVRFRNRLAQMKREAETLQAAAREQAQRMQENLHERRDAADPADAADATDAPDEDPAAAYQSATCAACGATNGAADRYCGECGAKL